MIPNFANLRLISFRRFGLRSLFAFVGLTAIVTSLAVHRLQACREETDAVRALERLGATCSRIGGDAISNSGVPLPATSWLRCALAGQNRVIRVSVKDQRIGHRTWNQIFRLRNIEELLLFNVRLSRGDVPKRLLKIKTLKRLHVGSISVTPELISDLRSLSHLEILSVREFCGGSSALVQLREQLSGIEVLANQGSTIGDRCQQNKGREEENTEIISKSNDNDIPN